MAYAVITLSALVGNSNEDLKTKCKLIYWRLVDIILKLDHIEGGQTGEEYLNLDALSTHTRLE